MMNESNRSNSKSKDSQGRPRRPVIVIVGAGFAGLMAAKQLLNSEAYIIVIDKQNHHLFQPLLYQVATATLSPSDISIPIRSTLKRRRKNSLRIILAEVSAIDRDQQKVITTDGCDYGYDYLIMATGSQYNYFGKESWQANACSLKTNEDALFMRQRLLCAFEKAELQKDPAEQQRSMTFVVIGAGPTGVEMAGALVELAQKTLSREYSCIEPSKARIVLLEAADDILNGFPQGLRAHARRQLRNKGVELRLGAPVEDVGRKYVVASGETVEAEVIIWCAGVKATSAADWLNIEGDRAGKIQVLPDLSIPGEPNIFVVGDLAKLAGSDGEPLPALAPVAKQQGAYAGKVIASRVRRKQAPKPFRYQDWGTMATIGRGAAVGTFGGFQVSGLVGWILWGIVHIFYLIGFRNRLRVLINWLWAIFRAEKGGRIIIGSFNSSSDGDSIQENQGESHSS